MNRKGYLLCVLALLTLATLLGCRSQLIFQPDKEIRITPADVGLAYETVFFETSDKVRISAWWMPAQKPIAVVLFFHGNGGNISHFLDYAVVWNRLGLSTLSVDYRGYGLSAGHPTEQGTYRDAEAAWIYLVEQRVIDPQDIIIYGKSLGGSVAARLAQTYTPGLLIVHSSFTRIAAVAHDLFPWAPAGLILGNAYNTQEYLKSVRCPVLVIHSRDDEIVRFHHGQELYEIALGKKEFLALSGSHNGDFYQSLLVYESGLKDFINKYLPSK
ncbi:MAG TPA: alpha/beta hydrolase [Syntrophorhabdaceae bacterium]|nr:alpha/beta hydrolase [Syntrophorhabdaceae bacterium]